MNLKQFDTQNQLDLRAILEAGSFPFKDQLLDYLNKREQELNKMQEGQSMQPGQQPVQTSQLPPDLAKQMQDYQFNPELINKFNQLSPEQQQLITRQK